MNYVKTIIGETTEIKTTIECDNIFTICPKCGLEHQVDVIDIASSSEDFCLYGTQIYCEQCSNVISGS